MTTSSSPTRKTSNDQSAALARQIHGIVKGMIAPNPWIYWTDMLLTAVIGYTGLYFYLTSPHLWAQILSFFVVGHAFYRGITFIHEISHFRRGTFLGFRIAWNAFFGVPCFVPSFMYSDHKSHHVNHSYGTEHDGEYFPIGLGPVRVVYFFLLHVIVKPVGGFLRFLVLGPLSYLHPSLRKLVWQRTSSLPIMNPYYRRPMPTREEQTEAAIEEAAGFFYAVGLLGVCAAGLISWWVIPKILVVLLYVAVINNVRALSAHRYLNDGREMTYLEQLLDSTTISENPITGGLWAPLGMRYHALHHLVPSLPYHALGKAHRKLMAELPADSPYRTTVFPTLFAAIRQVYHDAKQGGIQSTSVIHTAA